MDAYTIQEHVANYLNSVGIPHLDHAYAAQPEKFGANLAEYGSGTARCIAFVNVLDDDDVRESGPAANPYVGQKNQGRREFAFQVQVEVLHASNADGDWPHAEMRLKRDVVEGICQAIKTDPTLGTWNLPTPLFNSAGETKRGIKRTYALPEVNEDSGDRWQWASIVFFVCQYEVG